MEEAQSYQTSPRGSAGAELDAAQGIVDETGALGYAPLVLLERAELARVAPSDSATSAKPTASTQR